MNLNISYSIRSYSLTFIAYTVIVEQNSIEFHTKMHMAFANWEIGFLFNFDFQWQKCSLLISRISFNSIHTHTSASSSQIQYYVICWHRNLNYLEACGITISNKKKPLFIHIIWLRNIRNGLHNANVWRRENDNAACVCVSCSPFSGLFYSNIILQLYNLNICVNYTIGSNWILCVVETPKPVIINIVFEIEKQKRKKNY